MINIQDIHGFFNQLRKDNGAIWIEKKTIRLSTSKMLQNAVVKRFITRHKHHITSILKENKVYSKGQFLSTLIFRDTMLTCYPLSHAQERLWFIEKYEQGSNAYHIPSLFELDNKSNIEGIKYALQQVVSRHEVLRTTIGQMPNGKHGIQRVHDAPLFIEEIKITSARNFKSVIRDEINRPFNLESGYPIRVTLFTIPSKKMPAGRRLKKREILLINIHHIATDGWSVQLFETELNAYYEAFVNNDASFSLPPLKIQYKDYSVWQRAFLAGPFLEEQAGYWKIKLSGFGSLDLPTDFTRPGRFDYKGAHYKFDLGKGLSNKLRALARQNGTTLHCVLLSSINILLQKYTGQDDIVTGSPVANRHHAGTEGLIGFFVNIQVNRTRLNSSQSFTELIQKIHQQQVQAQLYQDFPFEKLVEELGIERDPSRHPIFQVMFEVHGFNNSRNRSKQQRPLKAFHAEGLYDVAKFDLSFHFEDSHSQIRGEIIYATSLFRKDTIVRMIDHYRYLLEQLVTAPGMPYSQRSLVDSGAHHQLVSRWNKTRRSIPESTPILTLLQTRVDENPHKVALACDGRQVTYKQLNERSNQLARLIRRQYRQRTGRQFAAGTLVPLFAAGSMETVTGILAILKAGGAYVPMDDQYPVERINYVLKDTGAVLTLCGQKLADAGLIQGDRGEAVCIELDEGLYKSGARSKLPSYNSASDPAYVIYTSGTTGTPKGVVINHGSLANMVIAQKRMLTINSGSVMLQYASPAFDASVWEIFTALSSGAQLSIVPPTIRKDARLLAQYLESEKITIALLPPALLATMPYRMLPRLKTLLVGGEVSQLQTMSKWSIGRKLINAYGPTEASVIATMHLFRNGDSNTNIGRPVANTNVYVLDKNQAPVPVGVKGEMYISGAGVAAGYLNKPDLTADRFVYNPFAGNASIANDHSKLYRTGDMVRWLPDGNLQYIGRNDDQVKIRGFRIELAEVTHALSAINGIRQCCILVKERRTAGGTDKMLVGYYVPERADNPLSHAGILHELSRLLPAYMVPSLLINLPGFRLTGSGKIDTRALPDHGFTSQHELYVAPVDKSENALCKAWEKVLGVDRVGVTDDFFSLGGNSILAIQACYRMSRALKYDVMVADLFRFKTIRSILNAPGKGFELVKSYNDILGGDAQDIIFIHPGIGGAEVYQNLAELLAGRYNCIGIENYNYHHNKKITSLTKLSQFYLGAYEKKRKLKGPINLAGWSLGGQLALDMAAVLEERGHKDIKIYLLDSWIRHETSLSTRMRAKVPAGDTGMKRAVNGETYRNKNTTVEIMEELANTRTSIQLKYTNVVLFKARRKSGDSHAKRCKANNIDQVAKNLTVIPLNCLHENILDTRAAEIAGYILSHS